MVKYYKGGLSFESAFKLSYYFLCELSRHAEEINRQTKDAMEN